MHHGPRSPGVGTLPAMGGYPLLLDWMGGVTPGCVRQVRHLGPGNIGGDARLAVVSRSPRPRDARRW